MEEEDDDDDYEQDPEICGVTYDIVGSSLTQSTLAAVKIGNMLSFQVIDLCRNRQGQTPVDDIEPCDGPSLYPRPR